MIIETCPECGADLVTYTLTSFPPIQLKVCTRCEWNHREENKIIRIPYGKLEGSEK